VAGETSLSPEREHVLALAGYAAEVERQAREILNPLLRDLDLGRQLAAGPCEVLREHAEEHLSGLARVSAKRSNWPRTATWWSGVGAAINFPGLRRS